MSNVTHLPVMDSFWRPATRADCFRVPRPCPYVGCRHNLYLDVSSQTGRIKFSYPELEPGEMKESCSLDVAERGGVTLESIGSMMGVTRERIRQMEALIWRSFGLNGTLRRLGREND